MDAAEENRKNQKRAARTRPPPHARRFVKLSCADEKRCEFQIDSCYERAVRTSVLGLAAFAVCALLLSRRHRFPVRRRSAPLFGNRRRRCWRFGYARDRFGNAFG